MTTDTTLDPQLNFASMNMERDELIREQASGAWDWKPEMQTATYNEAAHEDWVRTRVKRIIELTSILRRTNTGPGKAKTKRTGKAAPALAPGLLD